MIWATEVHKKDLQHTTFIVQLQFFIIICIIMLLLSLYLHEK